jgi:hypothetical protein
VSIEYDKRSGQPSTSKTTENVEKLREVFNKDCHRTIHELTDTIGISYGDCQILKENLNMLHIAPSQKRASSHVPDHKVCD